MNRCPTCGHKPEGWFYWILKLVCILFTMYILLTLTTLLISIRAHAQSDPLNCTGYPESRVFLESHSWYLTTPDQNGHNYGHIHAGACFPLMQTISGKVHFDLRLLMFENPGTINEYRVDVRSGSGGNQQSVGRTSVSLKCATQLCSWFVPIDVDTTKFPYDGRASFLFQGHAKEPDGNIAFVSGEWQAIVKNGKAVSDYRSSSFGTRGAAWYTNDGYAYANLTSQLPSAPVSGVWSFKLSSTTNQRPITYTFVAVDPNFHVHPPDLGTVIYSAPGSYSGTLSIDTRVLTNGQHFLFIRADSDDPAGSTNSGGLKLPFVVANASVAGSKAKGRPVLLESYSQ